MATRVTQAFLTGLDRLTWTSICTNSAGHKLVGQHVDVQVNQSTWADIGGNAFLRVENAALFHHIIIHSESVVLKR
jgi:hypothetical protein